MIDPDLRLTYLRLGKPTQLFLSLFMLPEDCIGYLQVAA